MNTAIATTLQHMQRLTIPVEFDEDAADARIQLRLHQIYEVNAGIAPINAATVANNRSPRRQFQRVFAGLLVVASVFAVMIARQGPTHGPSRNLVLVAARETIILDADGKPIPIELGAMLQEGTVIRVGKLGTATIGSTTLSAGAVAHVQNGTIVIDTPGAPTTTPTFTQPTGTTITNPQSSTSSPDRTTATSNTTPQSTSTTLSGQPAPPTTRGISTTTGIGSTRSVAARLQILQDTLTVQWQWPSNDRVAGIIIVAHAPGADPSYPIVAGSGSARLFFTQLRSTTATAIRWVGGARILVIAVDHNQRILGQSSVLIAPAH